MNSSIDPWTLTSKATAHLAHRHQNSIIVLNNPLLTNCSNYEDFKRIERQVHSTFPVCRIEKIQQVNHPGMYGMYLLRMEELQFENKDTDVQERILYHVTTEENALKSLENGLDWRRTKRSKYGMGVSFSDDADYADFYSNNKPPQDNRVIIVCTVLMAKTLTIKPDLSLKIPPQSYDTTVCPQGRVFVKYNDYEFYPLYLVYYQRKAQDVYRSRYFNINHPKHREQLKMHLKRQVKEEDGQRQWWQWKQQSSNDEEEWEDEDESECSNKDERKKEQQKQETNESVQQQQETKESVLQCDENDDTKRPPVILITVIIIFVLFLITRFTKP